MQGQLMEYNSEKENLVIPAYGRHVQSLINYTKTIEDDADRQAFAERIVVLMMQMNPQSKNIQDYKERLWKHLFRIADYDIKVSAPEGLVISKEEAQKKPAKIDYPRSKPRFRHYGNNVHFLVEKASKMEDEEKKAAFAISIATYMKLAYKTWSREHYVNDEIIKKDLMSLSNGALKIPENVSLDLTVSPSKTRKKRSGFNSTSNNNGGKDYRSKKGGHKGGYKKKW